jgi:hypothetical protein
MIPVGILSDTGTCVGFPSESFDGKTEVFSEYAIHL